MYEEAIRVHPNEPRAYTNLGDTFRDLADIACARAMYQQALKVCPTFSIAHSNLLYLHSFARDVTPEEELAVAREWEKTALLAEERANARLTSKPTAGVFKPLPSFRQCITGVRVRRICVPCVTNLFRSTVCLTRQPPI